MLSFLFKIFLLLLFLEAKLGVHELPEMNSDSEALQQTHNKLFEFKLVLSKVVAM
jgi:hypothetical protein